MKNQGVDIIGDIHGRADELEALLKKLGYREHSGCYRHPHRNALFLGDLIDRGNQNARVVRIVRDMVDHGKATAIMGNHEYNAICYHTRHPETGKPLREHTDKNQKQHAEFLAEVGVNSDHCADIIDWFRSLQIFQETKTFRAIHASWHSTKIQSLKNHLKGNILTNDFLLRSSDKTSHEHTLIEDLLKGPEHQLPEGKFFIDKDGNKRQQIRTRWWQKNVRTYSDAAIADEKTLQQIANIDFPDSDAIYGYPEDALPVFFGHYWLRGKPALQRSNIACLDYSVALPQGALCAYRHEGEKKLCASRFMTVSRLD